MPGSDKLIISHNVKVIDNSRRLNHNRSKGFDLVTGGIMAIYEFEGRRPKIALSSYVHPSATIIGNVIIGENCYIAPGVVLRGDWVDIGIGDGANVQDNTVIHGGLGGKVEVGPACHIGHSAVLHSVKLGVHVLVGMNATLLDGCELGDEVIVAAGAVVLARTVVPAAKLLMGVPATIVQDVSKEMMARWWESTRRYQTLPNRSRETLREITWEEATGGH